MSAQHTPPGPMIVGSRQRSRLLQWVWVPLKFWEDHSDRQPCDAGSSGICYEERRTKTKALVYGDYAQLECLRSDAVFYAEGNVDDAPALVRSAKATVAAIAKATGAAS